MGGSRAQRTKRSRHRQLEPLISTRRDDGLWQSIERDEEDLASHAENHAAIHNNGRSVVPKDECVSDQHMTHQVRPPHRGVTTATGKSDISGATCIQDTDHAKKGISAEDRSSTSSRADVLAWVSVSPPQRPIHPPPLHPDPVIPRDEPPSQRQPHEPARRRRGRPKKSRNAPNWNRPRRVRFSAPIPPADLGPPQSSEPRDTHVFVRLLKIMVTAESAHPPQRQELVWNNRAKGWRLAGERSERNIGDIGELFDDLPANASLLRAVLVPTLQRGAREPVEVAWDASRCCFQGQRQEGGSLAVALGEMKDMVKDPWARQFVGYVLVDGA